MGEHYAGGDLWGVVEAALRAAGKDPLRQVSREIAALDHFHTGGMAASRGLLEIAPDMTGASVLDLGAGIGGGSRFPAEAGAAVVSFEPSHSFCEVNRRLLVATGLASQVDIVQGDGLALPFASESFDVVWMQQAAMNIANKGLLADEIARVLRPGGCFVFQEVAAGANPWPLELPVAWAASQDESHLISPGAMRELLVGAGLDEHVFEDITEALLPGLDERLKSVEANGEPILGVHLLTTSGLGANLRGMWLSEEAGRIAFVRGVFLKPG